MNKIQGFKPIKYQQKTTNKQIHSAWVGSFQIATIAEGSGMCAVLQHYPTLLEPFVFDNLESAKYFVKDQWNLFVNNITMEDIAAPSSTLSV